MLFSNMKEFEPNYPNYLRSLSIFFSDLLDKTLKGYFSNNSLNLILVLKSPWKYLKEPDVSGLERVTCLRTNYLCYRLGRREETFFWDFEVSYIGTCKPLKNTDFLMILMEATETSWHKLSILTMYNLQFKIFLEALYPKLAVKHAN